MCIQIVRQLHSWVRAGMAGGEFFLAALQVAASPGRGAVPASCWSHQATGPPPTWPGEGLSLAPSFPQRWASALNRDTGRAFDGALQSSALKRKEREAPQESPSARKKVMRVPVTSLSCGSTCLGYTGEEL